MQENWNYKELKPTDLNTIADKCLEEAKLLIDGLFAETENRTVENTFTVVNKIDIIFDNTVSRLAMLMNLHPRKNIRASAEKNLQKISSFASRFSLDPRLYEIISAVDVVDSDEETKRLKEHTLRDLKRYGADKDEDTRNKIFELRRELTALSMEFARNIAEAVSSVTASLEELKGVPDNVISRLKRQKDGKRIITTNYSDYFPVIQFCETPELRRKMVVASHTRAPENEEVLRKILEKRHELTQLLGYQNWADYAAETRMSGSADAIDEFITVLDDATRESAEQEAELLLRYMKADGITGNEIFNHDRMYYTEVVKRERFGYNPQEFMQYFPYEEVEKGVLGIYSDLFDIEFKQNKDMSVWHKSVTCYDVLDNGNLLGRIYLDMHPRKGKYKHAACGSLVSGVKGVQVPESFLMCNFPGGRKADGAALMQFSQVSTFFHEFGHLLHNIFSGKSRWVSFAGISTEEDFVETPSQLLEEWLFEPRVLQQIGRHYKTGEPIPEELIEKLKVAEEFGKALHVRRQTFLSAASFYMHTDNDPANIDFSSLWSALTEQYSPYLYEDGTHMWTAWGHLSGYSSNYYTYMWSLAIAKDLMTGFDSENLMDKNIAARYRECILEPGGSRDAADMVKDFLGREYNFDSFKEWIKE
ncbi:MAG: M3 family metallopeptidase [Candidatus Spechtbacterales bacterium]|nr:M3 family metallopeptidase [Candidatus Spechtbacterales bacterium]